MTKKQFDLDKLESVKNLKPKKTEPKIDTEQAVKSIHNETKEKPEKEKLKRITIDMPFSVYVDIRKKVIEEDISLKDYFLNLAKKDLQV